LHATSIGHDEWHPRWRQKPCDLDAMASPQTLSRQSMPLDDIGRTPHAGHRPAPRRSRLTAELRSFDAVLNSARPSDSIPYCEQKTVGVASNCGSSTVAFWPITQRVVAEVRFSRRPQEAFRHAACDYDYAHILLTARHWEARGAELRYAETRDHEIMNVDLPGCSVDLDRDHCGSPPLLRETTRTAASVQLDGRDKNRLGAAKHGQQHASLPPSRMFWQFLRPDAISLGSELYSHQWYWRTETGVFTLFAPVCAFLARLLLLRGYL